MNLANFEKYSCSGDTSKQATGTRIKAARLLAGISQRELGEAGGVGKTAVTNLEKGKSYPNRDILIYFYRNHRVDLNFLVLGHHTQLPVDVAGRLYDQLVALHNKPDLP